MNSTYAGTDSETPTRVLIVEDVPWDSELMRQELVRNGVEYVTQRVDSEPEFREALKEFRPDVILADHSLPRFSGMRAFRIVEEFGLDTPVILVSGAVTEEVALQCLQAGVADYLMKDNLLRLGPAVRTVLESARIRRANDLAQQHVQALSTIVADSLNEIYIFAADTGLFLHSNPAALTNLGYTRDELYRLTPLDLTPEFTRTEFESLLQPLRRGETDAVVFKTIHKRKDQTTYPVEVHLQRLEYMGEPAFVAIILDLEVHRKVEDERASMEMRFSAFADSTADAMIVSDADARIRFWNRAATSIFGFSAEEIMGKPVLTIVPERLRSQREVVRRTAMSRDALANSGPERTAGLHKSGVEIPIEVTLGSWDEGGERFLSAVVRDVTERVEAEEERQLLATAVEHAAEAIVITDAGARIQYVNPAFELLTGYTREEAIGRNPRMLQSGQQNQAFYEQMWGTLARGHVWTGRLTNKKKDGTLFEEDATISPVRDADGKIVNYVAVKRDVTREIELEARLVQTQKMEAIGTLAGGIAHDFNNILQIMLGYLHLAQTDTPADSPAAASLGQIAIAGHRASDLVGQILAFSRQSKRERRPLRLQSIANEVLKLLRSSIPSTIEIRQFIDPACSTVLADATEVHQVMMNLCTNAYQAMQESGGVLEVRLENVTLDAPAAAVFPTLEDRMTVRLSVRDTGSGMDGPTMERIFDPYFTTKKVGEGTGLGLATVQGIVESCGGAVTVESEPGVGTVFEVYFPHAPLQTDAGGQVAVHEGALPVGTEHILFVDDEPMVAEQARLGLASLGYEVTSRTSSVEALEVFRAAPGRFDVVITDQTMPDLTGLELARQLAVIRPGIPVILCTGFSELVNETTAEEAGIRECLNKPVLHAPLAAAVRRAMDEEGAAAKKLALSPPSTP